MKALLFALDGTNKGEVDLPIQFNEEYRPDLIKRAYHSEASYRYQPKGAFVLAGMQTTAEYYGRRHAWRQIINTGRSRLPREKIPKGSSGRVLIVPHARKGRRAHPPKVWTRLVERVNLKEKNFAIRSALSACANAGLVKERGYVFEKTPLVIDDSFQEVKRSKEAKKVFEALGLKQDLLRAREGRRMRSGRARLRKGGYRTKKSLLVVIAEDKGVWKACRNLPGVDVVKVSELTAETLAPGGNAGRLLILTNGAVEKLSSDGLYL